SPALAGTGGVFSSSPEGIPPASATRPASPPVVTSATVPGPDPTATTAPTSVTPTAVAAAPPAPTATTLPSTYTPVPATPVSPLPPTATPIPVDLSRGALLVRWPGVARSRVVVVRHSGVWTLDEPDPAIVLDMLDAGLSTLTDVPDALAVWRALFDPGDRVLLKVNCIAYGGPTQPAVAYAVAQRLQDAGLRPENVLIFDRTDSELASAGYTLNEGQPGVQCHGARGVGTEAPLTQATVQFYQELDACDAVINVPTPKQHGMSGVSAALKNHYGSIDHPGRLHGNQCDPAIAEVNNQPTVRDKTRLIVGAALGVSPGDWNQPTREQALLLSFDPVALDTVSRDILVRHRQALGQDPGYIVNKARHLATAQALGLGATDAGLIDLREVTLG
ncbi:MAG: DUF362 domain-containing protein, partial [Chloroflexi bacterium]|nr:DUF362 domain-containing protein [Chloroflexota bacterium]